MQGDDHLTFRKTTYFLSLILCLLLLCSCRPEPSASDVALGYYHLITRQDASSLIALGMPEATADHILSEMQTSLAAQIHEQLTLDGQVIVSEEDTLAVLNAYCRSLHRLSPHITDEAATSGRTVRLTTHYIDAPAIDEAAISKALDVTNRADYASEEAYLTQLTRTYITALIKGFEEAIPSQTQLTQVYPFTLQDGLYLPQDYEAFTTGIFLLVTHQG